MHESVSDDGRVLMYTYALLCDIHVGLNSGTVPAVLGHLTTTCVNLCSDNIILLIFYMPREKCWKCLRTFPMSELRNHMRECSCSDDCDDFETPRMRQLVKTEYCAYAIMPVIFNKMHIT